MKCTSCGGKMVEQKHDRVLIDFCEGCAAVFFDPGELQRTQRLEEDELWNNTATRELGARIDCPSCRKPMHATDFDGVMIEGCILCGGFFMDWPSLTALAEKQGLDSVPGEPAETDPGEPNQHWLFGGGVAKTFVGRLFA